MNEVRGFKEFDRALGELPKATARNVLRRVGVKAMKRMEDGMAEKAPRDEGTLAGSMRTQVVTAKRARGQVKFDRASGVTVMTGPAPEGKLNRSNAGFQEFGTVKMAANSYARPTADSENENVVDDVRHLLGVELDKAVARIKRKAAKV